ncbi:hypothetical protein QOZ80_2BG0190250 [Eleusine coracana subsp. coracana]|nr:hypothetical protein QOZ80_2BG0190250 [Eleusine coracana subsp. coracana]
MSLSRLRRGREEDGGGDGRAGGDEGQRESTLGKRPRHCSCSCCQEMKDFYECQIEILKKEMQCMSKGFIEDCKILQREMQEFYQNSQLQLKEKICESMEQLIREQFNTSIMETSTSEDQHLRKYNSLRAIHSQNRPRTYRLKFENKCCNDKYSRHDITADDGNPIKVAIYDHDYRIITEGPLSSMQVKIVVLNGEFNNDNKEQWSGDSFRRNIIHARPGKPPLFSNEQYLRLKNGVASLYGAKFQDNSSFVPSKKFRMGVMPADDSISEKILEGISESFSVKDGRGFSKKKDPHPSLGNPIYKLKKIAENGDRHKLLEQMQIKLVKDFVRFYKKDKDSLRKACANISDHDWDVIVEHALSCKPGHECFSYHIPAMDATIFFNSLYNIVGAEFSGKYSCYEELDSAQKDLVEASKMEAYDSLTAVEHEDKRHFSEHEVIAGDRGRCYLRGSCSIVPLPMLPTKFHDETSPHSMDLESGSAQESPHPRQRWIKLVTMVTTVHFWNKKPSAESSIGMADTSNGSQVEPEINDGLDLSSIFFDSEDFNYIF